MIRGYDPCFVGVEAHIFRPNSITCNCGGVNTEAEELREELTEAHDKIAALKLELACAKNLTERARSADEDANLAAQNNRVILDLMKENAALKARPAEQGLCRQTGHGDSFHYFDPGCVSCQCGVLSPVLCVCARGKKEGEAYEARQKAQHDNKGEK